MGIPLPALTIKPPESPLSNLSDLLHAKSQMQGNQLQQQQIQGAQQENQLRALQIQDQQVLRTSAKGLDWAKSDTFDKWIANAQQNGVSPQTLSQLSLQRAQYKEQLAKTDKATLDSEQERNNQLLGHIDAIKAEKDPAKRAAIAQSQASQILSGGLVKDPQTTQMVQAIAQGQHVPTDDELQSFETGLVDHKTQVSQAIKEREVAATEQKNALQAKEFAAKMPGGAMQPVEQKELSDYLSNTNIDKGVKKDAATFAAWKAKQAPLANFNLQMQAGGGLSKEALDQQAENYYQTGKLPPGGRGAAGVAQNRAIMNRAAELHAGQSLAEGSAEYKANAASLKGLQETFDNVSAFENTAGKNLDLFLKQATKISDAGAKFLNTPIRMVTRDMIGTGDMAAFDAARTTALTEIAKVLNSPKGSGVLSDSARNEAEELIGKNATLDGIMKAANVLKQDMANRHQSYAEQIETIKGRLGGKAKPQGSEQNSAPLTITLPSGKKITVQ